MAQAAGCLMLGHLRFLLSVSSNEWWVVGFTITNQSDTRVDGQTTRQHERLKVAAVGSSCFSSFPLHFFLSMLTSFKEKKKRKKGEKTNNLCMYQCSRIGSFANEKPTYEKWCSVFWSV
ncbi:hypothetical protein HOY82DRAFT_104857 [Tuber indicum]|nr:hypothetical protein HOY82DRAFT_104857 [Tuber indicum]